MLFFASSIDFDLGTAEWTDPEDSYLTAVVPSHVDFDHWFAHDFTPVPSDVDFDRCFADDLVPSDFDVDLWFAADDCLLSESTHSQVPALPNDSPLSESTPATHGQVIKVDVGWYYGGQVAVFWISPLGLTQASCSHNSVITPDL